MLFSVTADKMVMIGGKIVTIKAGEFETTDKSLIEHLGKIKGVSEQKEVKAKAKANK